jgi:hypothetical protein
MCSFSVLVSPRKGSSTLWLRARLMRDMPAVGIIQGGSNMTGTDCDFFYTHIVPVIFQPPYINTERSCVTRVQFVLF